MIALLKFVPAKAWIALAALLAVLGLGWYIHHAGYESGYNASQERQTAAIAKAQAEVNRKDAEYAATLQSINTAHVAERADLAARLAAALATPPAVRIVRVRYDAGSSVPEAPRDAGELKGVQADTGAAGGSQDSYKALRDGYLTQGAKLEECQTAVSDTLKAW